MSWARGFLDSHTFLMETEDLPVAQIGCTLTVPSTTIVFYLVIIKAQVVLLAHISYNERDMLKETWTIESPFSRWHMSLPIIKLPHMTQFWLHAGILRLGEVPPAVCGLLPCGRLLSLTGRENHGSCCQPSSCWGAWSPGKPTQEICSGSAETFSSQEITNYVSLRRLQLSFRSL